MFNYNTKKSSIKLESINIKEKERIRNIKSTKLLFSNPLTIQNINQSLSVPNKFFHFSKQRISILMCVAIISKDESM